MDLNHCYILLLLKMITAENGFWPDSINQFGNINTENEELKKGTDDPKDLNHAILYYYGSNRNLTFSLENPDNNVVLKHETYEKQPTLKSKAGDFNDQETDIYNNYEWVESLKDIIFNNSTLTTNLRTNEEIADGSINYLKDLLIPSEIKPNYIQPEPETIIDITNYEKLIDVIDVGKGLDKTKLSNNYDYSEPHPPSPSIDFFSNFLLKLLEDKNKLKPNVKIEAISSQYLPEHIANDLSKPLNNLPIISTNVQPNTKIILKNSPRHHHHNVRQNYIFLP